MNCTSRTFSLTILFAFLFVLRVPGVGLSYTNSVVQISQQDGLPNNLVECIVQDHDGYLWFGTKRGLCRYDGYSFTNYRSDIHDSTSLPYHHITALHETSDSTLWVGVWRNGLCRYNRDKQSFSSISQQKAFPPKQAIIAQIFEDSKKRIWLIHDYGISILNSNGDPIKEMDQDFFNRENPATAIFETKDEQILIAAGTNIFSFNSSLQTFEQINYSGAFPIGTIHQFHRFNDSTLWLAADYGLLAYDLSLNTISSLLRSSSGPYKFIFEDDLKNIWSGGSSPVCYERESREFLHIDKQSAQDPHETGNSLTCGISDTQNNLWFGNTNAGVSVLYKSTALFDSYPDIQKFLKENALNVTAIFRDREDMLFVGTQSKGTFMFDKEGELKEIVTKYPGLSGLKNHPGSVRDIKSDSKGNLWFAIGDAEGLIVYDPYNNSCETHARSASSLCFDSKGNSLIGGSGIVQFDLERKQFILYQSEYGLIDGVADILEDETGKIWLASHDDGFFIVNSNEKKCVKANEKFSTLPDTKGISLLSDSKGRMWLGSEFYGLFYKDRDQDQFTQLTRKDGLPSNDICSLLEDRDGNIWIGTNHGLSRYDYTTGRFKNYFVSDGLCGDEFNFNAFYVEDDGVLLFGTTKGLVAFDPDDIEDDHQPLPVVICEVAINNGNVDSDVHGLSVREALNKQDELVLKHDQNTIHIKFSTINLASSKKSQFAYMLSGIDEDYQYVGDLRQVNYSKLPPGDYQFSVIASNNDNFWGEEEATFSFMIRRHPLKSPVAFIVYFILLSLVLVIVYRNIRYQNQLKHEVILEKMAKQQQEDLVKMKLRFFTNISHEFKTPLSLIISPLEELLKELHGNSSVKRKLVQIRRNSNRLLTLINQLIEFRKMEQDVLPVNKEQFNLLEITRNTMMLFSDLAEQRSMHFELKTAMKECRINSDKDKIEKILNNLLSNAFKHTPENGTITVSMTLAANHVRISVKDTGAGISEQNLKYIFDRFYQEEHKGQISGIGMAYVKKIVELLDGTIEVTSEIDRGTEVVLTIPEANQMPVAEVFSKSSNQDQILSVESNETEAGRKRNGEETDPKAPWILVVEDDYEMRKNLISILQDAYNVDEAGDGMAAFDMLQQRDYNLVLSDIMMPKMDGLELCSKIKSNPKTNHIIVDLLSAKDEFESEMEGYKTGANTYLFKPFLPEKLLSIIKNQLYTQQKAISHHSHTSPVETENPIGINLKDKEFLDQISLYIDQNLHEQEFGIERIGEEFGLSRSKLYKKFKVITNVSLKDFIKEAKMRKAAQMLAEDKLTATEIAYNLGFSSATNFFTAFKAYYGKTPKEFQKEGHR